VTADVFSRRFVELRRFRLVYLMVRTFNGLILRSWTRRKEGPPPPAVKDAAIVEYARRYGLDTLVETGTYVGDTLWSVRNSFRQIISVELSPRLARLAGQRLQRLRHIEVLQGDSAELLPRIVEGLPGSALFWLDAHYSGGATASGVQQTPVRQELEAILGSRDHHHVVLIDDARHFDGSGGYPTIDGIREMVTALDPDASFIVADDIIRIVAGPLHLRRADDDVGASAAEHAG